MNLYCSHRKVNPNKERNISVQNITPALPGEKLLTVIITYICPPAAPSKKKEGPTTAPIRNPKLPRITKKPTKAKPRLANATSVWNGLTSHSIKAAAISGKRILIKKL